MVRKFSIISWALSLAIVGLLIPYASRADVLTLTDEVRADAEKMLAVLNDPELKAPVRAKERRDKLKVSLYPRFDFTEMAKRCLGPEWQRRGTEERDEFVKIFADLLEASYSDKMESYRGQKILFTREILDGDMAEVGGKIVADKGDEYPVNYKLHKPNGEWKIYDVVVEDISLVNNYRRQFHRVLSHSSFEELLDRLREKQFQAKRGDRVVALPSPKLQFLTIFSALETRQGP